MKARSLLTFSSALFASGFFAAAVLAGPGPQHYAKPTPPPAEKPASTTAKVDQTSGNCGGCKTSSTWVVSDRGPAGKGVPGARISGQSHACTGCVGEIVTQNGKTRSNMQHSAACVPLACCK